MVAWMAVLTGHVVLAGIPLISEVVSRTPTSPACNWIGLLTFSSDVWLCLAFFCIIVKAISLRIQYKEKMSAEHFRKDWDKYASTRWRLVPFVY